MTLATEILQIVLLAYFGFASAYIFIFSFAALFPARNKKIINSEMRKFAVMIPGYKEDSVICEVAEDALKQDYPQEKYDVIIIADSFKPETIEALRKFPIKVIEVSFDLSTKSKALNKAMEELGEQLRCSFGAGCR